MGIVPDSKLVLSDEHAVADQALVAAEAAARSAGVRIRELREIAELEEVVRLYDGIWRRSGASPINTELLRAFAKAGNYIAGAFDGPALVGACVGFFSAPADGALHSHIAGVSTAVRGRAVGFALKQHQRAWALRRGVAVIAWTFDPLVSRNAWFNLVKLSAAPVEYLTNFYGGMRDGINGSDDSDRLLVHWNLAAPAVIAAAQGSNRPADAVREEADGAVVALGVSSVGSPVRGPLDGMVSLVAVPPDIEAMRVSDPDRAREWRVGVRDTLDTLMATGGTLTGFDRAGWYVVHRSPARPSAGG